jgi:hypothetical protein
VHLTVTPLQPYGQPRLEVSFLSTHEGVNSGRRFGVVRVESGENVGER